MPENQYTSSRLDKFIQNLPISAFKNFILNPILGSAAIPKIAYDVSPLGQAQYLGEALTSLVKKEIPKAPPGVGVLKEMLKNYYDTYKNPLTTLEEDPFRPVADVLSVLSPSKILKTVKSPGISRFRKYVMNKVGKIPSDVPAELMTNQGGWTGPSQREILEESLRRQIPLSWMQVHKSDPNAGFVEAALNPASAAIYDPLLEQRNRTQIGATRDIAQEILDPTQRLKVTNEPGVNARLINEQVSGPSGQTEQLWSTVKDQRNDIFNKAKETEVPFTYQEKIRDPETGNLTGEVRDVTVNIQAPILADETYPIVQGMKDDLNTIQASLMSNGLALSNQAGVVNKLKGILKNPAYQTLHGKFNIVDLETLYQTKQNLNSLRNYVKKQMGAGKIADELSKLNDAINNDIAKTFEDPSGHGFYSKYPELGQDFRNYLTTSREELKKTSTAAYKSLGKPTWEGTNPQEIMNDPAKAIPKMMGSYNEFEKGTKFLGRNTSRQVLLTDLFENALDENRGYNFGKVSEYLKNNRDKINLVMDTDQKHALGVWAGIVENQNKLNELQKAQQLFSMRKDQGVVNVASGIAAQRPGLLALGGVRIGQLFFARKYLAKIASDTDTAYAAARLSQTPVSHPSALSRTKDFLRKAGKLNIIGQFKNADGTTEDVTIDPSGEIKNVGEVSKPKWW